MCGIAGLLHPDAERRTGTVARMLAGSKVTKLSLSHARELLDRYAEG